MKFRAMEREAFRVFGVETLISKYSDMVFVQVPEFFRK